MIRKLLLSLALIVTTQLQCPTIIINNSTPPPSVPTSKAGQLDTGFATAGTYTKNWGGAGNIRAMVIQPDGKILIAGIGNGDWRVQRLTSSGVLDASFATAGSYTYDHGGTDDIYAMEVLSDGKILIVGTSGKVQRLSREGVLDTSFGTVGTYTASLGGTIRAMVVLSNGKILIGGDASDDWYVERLSADGMIDTSFGNQSPTDGTYRYDSGGTDSLNAMVAQLDEKIVIGGYSNAGGNNDWYAQRLSADGMIDTSFGNQSPTNGLYTVALGDDDRLHAIALQSNGKILFGGKGGSEWKLQRLTTSGTLDPTFATAGTYSFTGGIASNIFQIRFQSDGKILLGGEAEADDWQVQRLSADGVLDTSFASGGTYITSLGGNDDIHAMQIQFDGKILIAGDGGTPADWYVQRLTSDINPITQAASLGGGGFA